MSSPEDIQLDEPKHTLSQAAQELIAYHEKFLQQKERLANNTEDRIHVDEIATKIATFYERVRNVIEYHDAHLLRKETIERIVRRRVFLKHFNQDFAEPLVKELIRSGHLPNDAVPESKIPEVQRVLDTLLFLLGRNTFRNEREHEKVSGWLIRIFVPAIEEVLFPVPENAFVADVMFDVMKKNLVLKNVNVDQEELDTQLFITIQRALFRPDKDQLQYTLLKFANPDWQQKKEESLITSATDLGELKTNLEALLVHPLGPYLYKICNKEKIIFLLLGDLVFGESNFDTRLDKDLAPLYQRRYRKSVRQLRRLAFLSVASFFISKILIAVAVEIPLDAHLGHPFSLPNAAVNILFPPLLMLVIVALVRPPSSKNFKLVSKGIREVAFMEGERKYPLIIPKARSTFTEFLLRLVYLVSLVVVLYIVTKVLLGLGFSVASVVIFILFTSMVSATGVRVYNRAKELSLEKEKHSIAGFVLDLIAVPFTTIGKWTIKGLSKFNIIVITFNFLIELPFQLFVEFLENFRGFIRSKKEESN